MRLFLAALGVAAWGASALAGQWDAQWARMAGEHLGKAEAAATCPGMRLNGARRDEIIALYEARGSRAIFMSERDRARRDRVTAIKKDKRVCDTLVGAYGPRGLAIRRYVLRVGEPDVAEVPGVDRGVTLDVDPRGINSLHWISLVGAANAIETICPNYAMHPLVEAYMYVMGQSVTDVGDLLTLSATAMAVHAETYRLKEDRKGFCDRILADYGPESETPVVRRKTLW